MKKHPIPTDTDCWRRINFATISKGKSYYIDEEWKGTVSQDWTGEGSIDIYIKANAEFTGAWWNDDTPVNIYILKGAVLTYCEAGWDNMVKIKKATSVYCWGNIDTPEKMGFRLYEAGKVYIYDVEGEKPFKVKANDAYVTFQVDTQSDFYCEREMYVDGSARYFNNQTNVDADNRLISYDIKDLSGVLKTQAMLLVLDNVWNRLSANRNKGVATWIYIDEIHVLFRDPYCLSFIRDLYKRARKYGGVLTGITQNVEDLLRDAAAVFWRVRPDAPFCHS